MRVHNERARILVVDDEPSICRALTIAFARGGYDVRAVESGELALSLLRTEHFDCLVVDLRMPDVRGDVLFELAASLQPQLRACTVFTTGDASDFALELIGACGCAVIAKPFELPELLSVVDGMTAKRRGASA
jgi:two-component system, NtrC family, response regulator GlrR